MKNEIKNYFKIEQVLQNSYYTKMTYVEKCVSLIKIMIEVFEDPTDAIISENKIKILNDYRISFDTTYISSDQIRCRSDIVKYIISKMIMQIWNAMLQTIKLDIEGFNEVVKFKNRVNIDNDQKWELYRANPYADTLEFTLVIISLTFFSHLVQ